MEERFAPAHFLPRQSHRTLRHAQLPCMRSANMTLGLFFAGRADILGVNEGF
jgi:hypothetical protein